jgi:sugar lactone lactonase YvrE
MTEIRIGALENVRTGWGESARWDEALQRLYFVDCAANAFAWCDAASPGVVGGVALPSLPTAVYLTTDVDRVLVQLDEGLYAVVPSSGQASLAIAMPADEIRFNDGVADPTGAIVTGSLLLEPPGAPAAGRYWRYAPPAGWTRIHEGKGNTNGLCVTPDGRHLYVADSTASLIYRFDYPPFGELGGETVFADTRSLGGLPDGATLDAEGCLWSAIVGGSCVAQFAPDGALLRVVDLPTSHPTSVTFGGRDLDVLYVTTIGAAMLGIEPAGELAGALLTIEGLESQGAAAARCPF